jgi:hypothetical protein
VHWAEWFMVSWAALFVVVCLCYRQLLVLGGVDAESFFLHLYVVVYSFINTWTGS